MTEYTKNEVDEILSKNLDDLINEAAEQYKASTLKIGKGGTIGESLSPSMKKLHIYKLATLTGDARDIYLKVQAHFDDLLWYTPNDRFINLKMACIQIVSGLYSAEVASAVLDDIKNLYIRVLGSNLNNTIKIMRVV